MRSLCLLTNGISGAFLAVVLRMHGLVQLQHYTFSTGLRPARVIMYNPRQDLGESGIKISVFSNLQPVRPSFSGKLLEKGGRFEWHLLNCCCHSGQSTYLRMYSDPVATDRADILTWKIIRSRR